MENRCRLCAEAYHTQIEILQNSRFTSMLDYFFQLKINLDDKLPSSVCEGCYEFVERVWQFKEQVDQAQILLSDILSAVDVLPTTTILETQEPEIPVVCNEECKFKITDLNAILNPNESRKCFDGEQLTTPSNAETEVTQNSRRPTQKNNKAIKKVKRATNSSRKTKSEELDTFKEIEYINTDGTVVPKQGIGGWNLYPWTCSECRAVFCDADDLREHFGAAHNITIRYLCIDCPKVYTKYISFVKHVKYHRPLLKFSCYICYKWYATSKEIENHEVTHYEVEPYQCSTCGKRFRGLSFLNIHSRTHLPSDLKNCYPCDRCPKKFGTKPNLIAHKRIHLGVRAFTCAQCGRSFVQKGNLDNHMLIHEPARPFQCAVCDKSFKSLNRLKKHSSIHSGHKPHKCDICGRQFREKGTLKEHQRIHTGVMPFTCEFCGKCFRFKGVLTTHRRQHTGERPYSCTECQHHFTNWPNYNKHMKRRHGINTSVNCRTKQEIPPTGKPNRNPPGAILAAPQQPPPDPVVCHTNPAPIETYPEVQSSAFYPVLGLYGIPDDITKGVL